MRLYIIVLLTVLIGGLCHGQGKKRPEPHYGYAPPDAYLPGSPYPYYGNEEGWDLRAFNAHLAHLPSRRGQRQMLDIVEGRPEEAARYCRELLAKDPNDLESLFNLAVAQVQMNDLKAAMQSVQQAVDAGLPIQRFLAGPRDLLRQLTESEAFKSYAVSRRTQLIHGPLLGCVTDRSARFWVRTLDEVSVQVMASTSWQLTSPLRSETRRSKATDDYTAIVEIKGLKPGQTYHYEILLEGKPALQRNYPSFRTYPTPGTPAKFEVGFGGGAKHTPSNERMWDVIRSHNPLAFLFLGDNVYIDLAREVNGVHYYTYYRRQSRPEFRRFTSATSIYAIWDDHDAGTDDIWMGPYREKPAWKMSLLRNFRENWNNPFYGDRDWPGTWSTFVVGDVEFFLLDGRFYRTNPYDPSNRSMLGPVQKKWLLDRLGKSKATFKVLASPVPWTYESKQDALDTWNGFKEERTEIFDFLARNRIGGIVLLSADRHRSDAWKIDRPNGYSIFEFSSSRLTNPNIHELMPKALFGYNAKPSFGLLSFDTTAPDPTVTYSIVSIDNEVIHTLSVKGSQLSHR